MSLNDLRRIGVKRHVFDPYILSDLRLHGWLWHLLSVSQPRFIHRESLRSFHSHRMEPHLKLTARPLWPGCFRQTGFRPAVKAGLIPFCALKRSCSSTAPEKLFRSAREMPPRLPPHQSRGSENVKKGHMHASERLAQDRSEEACIWPKYFE